MRSPAFAQRPVRAGPPGPGYSLFLSPLFITSSTYRGSLFPRTARTDPGPDTLEPYAPRGLQPGPGSSTDPGPDPGPRPPPCARQRTMSVRNVRPKPSETSEVAHRPMSVDASGRRDCGSFPGLLQAGRFLAKSVRLEHFVLRLTEDCDD